MAEIRSTLDMVLERAERLCAEAPSTTDTDFHRAGMRAGARLIDDGEPLDIGGEFAAVATEHRRHWLGGLLDTLLRNLTLPHDDAAAWKPALDALAAVEGALGTGGGLGQLLTEIDSILGQYNGHRKQVRQQLEEAFAGQAAQLQADLARQTGMRMDVTPAQHPKFQEELQRHYGQLDDQYRNALDQYKNAIRERILSLV